MRLRNKVQYTDIAFNLMSEEFTMTDLMKVYEVILDKEMYRKNFRDKMKLKTVATRQYRLLEVYQRNDTVRVV